MKVSGNTFKNFLDTHAPLKDNCFSDHFIYCQLILKFSFPSFPLGLFQQKTCKGGGGGGGGGVFFFFGGGGVFVIVFLCWGGVCGYWVVVGLFVL